MAFPRSRGTMAPILAEWTVFLTAETVECADAGAPERGPEPLRLFFENTTADHCTVHCRSVLDRLEPSLFANGISSPTHNLQGKEMHFACFFSHGCCVLRSCVHNVNMMGKHRGSMGA